MNCILNRVIKYFLYFSLVAFTLAAVFFIASLYFQRDNIFEIKTLDLLKKEVSNLDQDSLVVFDVDHTIFVQEGDIFHLKAREINSRIFKNLTAKEFDDFYSKNASFNLMIIDAGIVDLIKNLQKKEIKVIALTNFPIGKLGTFEKMEDVRIKDLKKIDIDFSEAFPKFKEFELKELVQNNKIPLFKDGVLFGRDKGKILADFLEYIKWIPEKIIFVDDSLRNVKAVAQMAKEAGVNFSGYHYTAAEDIPYEGNEKLMKFQVDYFFKTGKLLRDKEALEKMRLEQINKSSENVATQLEN